MLCANIFSVCDRPQLCLGRVQSFGFIVEDRRGCVRLETHKKEILTSTPGT